MDRMDRVNTNDDIPKETNVYKIGQILYSYRNYYEYYKYLGINKFFNTRRSNNYNNK
jgi:hypothetical protein